MDEGAFQQYVLVDAGCCARIPDRVGFAEASVVPMAVATAGVAVFRHLVGGWGSQKKREEGKGRGGFLVWGGASSVGSGAVQIARAEGFDVFAVAGRRHHDYLKTTLGASFVFDHHDEGIVDDIVAKAQGTGVEITRAFDAISENGTPGLCAEVLGRFGGGGGGGGGGRLCVTLPVGADVEMPAGVEVSRTSAGTVATEWREGGTWLFNEWLEDALVSGSYRPSPGIQIVEGGLAGVQRALDIHKEGVSGVKLVVPLE